MKHILKIAISSAALGLSATPSAIAQMSSMDPSSDKSDAQLILTPSGLFTSCDEAVAFRDGPLVDLFFRELEALANGKQERKERVIARFEQHILRLKTEIGLLDEKQFNDLNNAFVKKIAIKTLEDVIGIGLKHHTSVGKRLSDDEIDGLKAIYGRMKTYGVMGYEGATGTLDERAVPYNLVADNLELLLSVVPQAKAYSEAVGWAKFAIEQGFAFAETELDKDVARAQIQIFKKMIVRVRSTSPKVVFDELQASKNMIDAECGHIPTNYEDQMSVDQPNNTLAGTGEPERADGEVKRPKTSVIERVNDVMSGLGKS